MAGQLTSVIWDMDGVIADTGRYHFQAWQEVFGKKGLKFTFEEFKRHFGQRNDTIIRYAFKGDISAEELDDVAQKKEANYRGRVAANVKALPGTMKLVKSLCQCGIKMAIASSSPPENIHLILSSLGIGEYFDAIVWGREVTEGKPSPQAFLLAAKKLNVSPLDCIVIEDAVAGVTAAKRAGMRCVAVTNTNPREKLGEADLIVDSLESVDVEGLTRLFNA